MGTEVHIENDTPDRPRVWHRREINYGLEKGSWDRRLPVGPERLLPEDPDEAGSALAAFSEQLLGHSDFRAEANNVLAPYRQNGKEFDIPTIFVPSASEQINAYFAEIHYRKTKGRAIGIDPAIITRELHRAVPGDVFIGRTDPFREAAADMNLDGVKVIDIKEDGRNHDEMYYTMEKLLQLALRYGEHGNPMNEIVDAVRVKLDENPESLFRIYTLDEPTQLWLTWLAGVVGAHRINVEANSIEGAQRNHKGYAYPSLEQAEQVDISGLSPGNEADLLEILRREGNQSQVEQELGITLPRMPGYLIAREDNLEGYAETVLRGVTRMRDLYGLNTVCLKHTRSSDGSGVEPGLSLDNIDRLREVIAAAHAEDNQDLVIEPHFHYETVTICGQEFILAPSAHLVNGESRAGMTFQMISNGEWQGNIDWIGDDKSILSNGAYETIQHTMQLLAAGIRAAEAAGQMIGIRKGGIDWAIGTIGGRFGEYRFIVPQDWNLRTSGAETHYGVSQQKPDAFTATKVLKPNPQISFQVLKAAIAEMGGELKVKVNPGWAYMAVHNEQSALTAAEVCLLIELRLRELNYVA